MAASSDGNAFPPGHPDSARRRSGDRIPRGAIPIAWLQSAARLPGRSLHAGLALWIAAAQTRSRVVQLSNLDGGRVGCGRNQKYRALAWLEAAGLVAVQRQLGRSPIVTILIAHPPSSAVAEAVKRSETVKATAEDERPQTASKRGQDGGSK